MKLLILLLILSTQAFSFQGKGKYLVSSAEITYKISYLLKKIEGTSKNVKGIADCSNKECNILIASPIKTFKSEDANRDLNMLNYTKASKHPIVQVRLKTPSQLSKKFETDLIIKFAGAEKTYKADISNIIEKNKVVTNAILPIKLSDFKVDRPSLLGISIDDVVPIHINLVWKLKK